jgi:hypothetical protein
VPEPIETKGPKKRRYRLRRPETSTPERPSAAPTPDELALARYARPRAHLIAEAAYYRSLRSTGADPVADWLAAEREIDALLTEPPAATPDH